MIPDLTEKHLAVVGGSSGIGRAAAALAARAGAKVSIAARDRARLEHAASAIGAAWASLDMTEDESIGAWVAGLAPLDYLAITASSAAHGRFDTLPVEDVRRMFDAKFFGPYAVARAALPKMREGGSITFFSGVLSRRPGLNCSGLGAVNSAVEGLTRALALELGSKLRVNCISPGMVRTEAYGRMGQDAREQMYRSTGESLPLGRVGEADEVDEVSVRARGGNWMSGEGGVGPGGRRSRPVGRTPPADTGGTANLSYDGGSRLTPPANPISVLPSSKSSITLRACIGRTAPRRSQSAI